MSELTEKNRKAFLIMNNQPKIEALGWKHNRSGGWWYREPDNRYTVQILPSSFNHGLRIGIAQQAPMRWLRRNFTSPDDAAAYALKEVGDLELYRKLLFI